MGFKSVNINEAVIEIQKGALIIDVREQMNIVKHI